MPDRGQGERPDPEDRDWFRTVDLRRIAGLVAMIAVAYVFFGLVFDVPIIEAWPFTTLIFVVLIGAFFVSSWADHYARRQIDGPRRQFIFARSVLMAYALTGFFVMKAILDL